MCPLNHCSAQTESSQTDSPTTASIPQLTRKLVLTTFLFSILLAISICIAVPSAFSQQISDSDTSLSLEEDPLAETDQELDAEEDPLAETDTDLDLEEDPLDETDPELNAEEDPLFETDTGLDAEEDPLAETDTGLDAEEDPLAETDTGLDAEEDPLAETDTKPGDGEDPLSEENLEIGSEVNPLKEISPVVVLEEKPSDENGAESVIEEEPFTEELLEIDEQTEDQEGEDQETEEEEFQTKVNFSHKVKTLLGASETKGLSILEPLLSEIKELRFVSTYDQSVKVHTSPRMYNYFRLSISFSQNYEVNKKRIFDGYATLREIYTNYRTGPHQLRYGTQIFSLGKVDLDKVIDVLHMNNVMGLYTFDPDDTKDSIPSIRYNWFRGGHTATMFLSPIRQQTFGMRFTEFREEVEKKESEKEEGKVSFLRDYYGLQYQWTGDIFDARFGLFHWFDANPYIKFEYQGASDETSASVQGSFENMLGNYTEKETRSDFLTFEIDAIWSDMVWKLESGYFKKRNFYSYEIPQARQIRLSTFQSPHFALATSFERTFKYFYWLMIYSHRKSFDVPENTHVFLYENESALFQNKRDVVRNQVSGVAVLKTPDNSLRITLLNYQTWPFIQKGYASLFTWEHYKENMELELKLFRLETERQKMLIDKISTNQVLLTYTQKFAAY
ncbi:MAG: hypothetical protein MAG581_01007 [Deltaproteobacteria bacterium]|nr:hypothetical protein [Deltaproteobacteria bacterium]